MLDWQQHAVSTAASAPEFCVSLECRYVMQDDLLNGHLTVEETLNYTARLRLPPTFTDKQRAERIEEVIVECNLSRCR
jgi:ABC-type multidrug transport system ATPase subunit